MAIIANTYQVGAGTNKSNREELADVVNRITPEDTPLYSLMRKSKAMSTHPEWLTDVLGTPAANAQLEGDEYAYTAVGDAARLGNYSQIYRKAFRISNTQQAIREAGNVVKRKYQKLKHGVEIRKDVELSLLANTATVAGSTRKLGSLQTWLETNALRGSSGSDGGYNSADGLTDVVTDGTQRAFTKALMDQCMQSIYKEGGNTKYLVVSPYIKQVFVSFMSASGIAEFRYAASAGGGSYNNKAQSSTMRSIIATADIYEGPFGKVTVMANRVMNVAGRARNAYFIDPMMVSFKWLRRIKEDTKARDTVTGDARNCVLLGEGTLCIKNEKGLGVVADVFGLTSAT